MRHPRLLVPTAARGGAAALFLALALSACGGEEDAEQDATPAADGCRTDLEVTYPDGEKATLDTAEAVELADGGAFTIYAGDYDIPTDGIATATVLPPTGSHQASIYLTVLGSLADAEPITAGTTVEYTTESDALTFSVVLHGDQGMSNQAVDGAGSLMVESVGDGRLCVEVDYSDEEKSVDGSISANVTESAF